MVPKAYTGILALTLGCSTATPSPKVTDSIIHDSPYTILIIPEIHTSEQCQKEIYPTIEDLLPKTRFVAVEGHFKEVSHDMYTVEPLVSLRTLPLHKRIDETHSLLQKGLPSYDVGWYVKALQAVNLIEAVYQDRVLTQGVENEELYNKSKKFIDDMEANKAEKMGDGRLPIPSFDELRTFQDLVLRQRSISFVDNTLKYVKADDRREYIILNLGDNHTTQVVHEFNRRGISTKVIMHPGCMDEGS